MEVVDELGALSMSGKHSTMDPHSSALCFSKTTSHM